MHTELLKVTGMTCGGCFGKVTKALQAVPGVSGAKVSLQAGEAASCGMTEHRKTFGEFAAQRFNLTKE